ncbi:hypothetical protein BV20DRAFT_305234 [Pilatotrama ljubarskyi]|nr:hypothetical protein BV20DRAFT_305234 [Pilatotrama ljubarskyi]
MKARLHVYPLSGEHGAVTVPLHGFFEELHAALRGAAARELQSTLPFIACDTLENRASGSAAPEYSKDVAGAPTYEPLHLRVLIITFQDVGDALDNTTRNQQHMGCTSAVRILLASEWRISRSVDCPFPVRTASSAWHGTLRKTSAAISWIATLDLTEESGVLRYVAFLAEIQEHARELQRRVEVAKPELIKRA